MSLRLVNTGEDYALQALVERADLQAILISANWTPADSDTMGSFTECDAAGYSRVTLDKDLWTTSTDESGTTSTTYNSPITFTFSETVTIYGYAVVYHEVISEEETDTLLWEEKLADPLVYGSLGGTSVMTPSISAD